MVSMKLREETVSRSRDGALRVVDVGGACVRTTCLLKEATMAVGSVREGSAGRVLTRSLLVRGRCTGLHRRDEAGADPDGRGAHHEGGGQQLAVVDAARGHDLDGGAREGRLVALAGRHDGRDQHRGGHVARVAAALAGLRADEVDADVERLREVLRVTDHLHIWA